MPFTGFTGSVQLADSTEAEHIARRVISTAYETAVLDNILGAFGDEYGHDVVTGTKTKSYTRLGSISAGALTEGTDGTPTALSDTQVSITVSEVGVGVLYGDVLDVANANAGGRARVRSLMGRAYGDYIDTLLLALASSFADAAGGASAMTEDYHLQAIHELEENHVPGPFCAIYHTSFVHSLRTQIAGHSGSTAAIYTRPGLLSRVGPAMNNNYAFTLAEVDVFKSTNVPFYNSYATRMGMMLPLVADYFPIIRLIGVPGEGPWAGQRWDGRYEEQRDASGRLTEMWDTGDTAVGVIATDYGVGVQAAS